MTRWFNVYAIQNYGGINNFFFPRGKATPIKVAISNQMCYCKVPTERMRPIAIQRLMKAPVLKLTEVPPSHSPHDETKKDKGNSNMLASKQNITASQDKKIITLKEFTNFQNVLLKEMGLFEDKGVKSKTLAYSLPLHFWTYLESEITLSAAGHICTKICLQLDDDAIDFISFRLLLLKRTANDVRYLTLHL